MTEIESDTPQEQLRTKLPEDAQSSFFVLAFISLTLSFAGCISLFFLTPMFRAELSGTVPGLAIFSLIMAICVLAIRQYADFFATKRGDRILLTVCFVGGALGPLLQLFGAALWWWALCVSAVGCVCIVYECWSHLCSLEPRVLVAFVSAAFFVGCVTMLVFSVLKVGEYAGTVIASIFLLTSTMILCFLDDGHRASLYSVKSRDSLMRLRSRSMRRLGDFNYFVVGLMVAIVIELVTFMVPERFGYIDDASAIMFTVAAALIFALSLFSYWHKSFDFEDRSKDYLTFTCALGFLPLPFISGIPQFVLLIYLILVVVLQLIVVATAIVELARFEEISPLWYVGETTYLFLGMCAGSLVAKVCFLQMPIEDAIIFICMFIVVFLSFAQILFNKSTYPEIELFRSNEEQPPAHIIQQALAAQASATDAQRLGLAERSGGAEGRSIDSEAEKLKGSMRFRNRIAEISDVYELSPRQREILELLAKGRNAGYIMDHFHISRSTVKTHVYNIYIKLEIHSRQELLDLIESDEELTKPSYL